MKVAVVGTGIAGLYAARQLWKRGVDLTVFEARDRLGGHTNTVDVDTATGPLPVDTGFIVFNRKTYPNFCALLEELGVAPADSDMSFSVKCEQTGLEYNGTNLDTLFAQRTNLVRPRFWRMVRDILRFYREAANLLTSADDDLTLGEYLDSRGYSDVFVDKHIVPMGAAIWSANAETMRTFPLRFLVQFFHNHGFLQVDGRPQWLFVEGGSRTYVDALTEPFEGRIRLSSPVARVRRDGGGGVLVATREGGEERFDRVFLACHGDQALRVLDDASPLERELLECFRFQENEAVLHTDTSLMPKRERAWASWNYHVTDPPSDLPTVTYWMNRLQALQADDDYLVTLNRTDAIDPAKVLRTFTYWHPIFSTDAVKAQRRHGEIDGVNGVHFCGAYWRYGFHEDGVVSAMAALENFDRAPVAAHAS